MTLNEDIAEVNENPFYVTRGRQLRIFKRSNKIDLKKCSSFFFSTESRFIDSHVTCTQDFIQLDVKFNSRLWQTLRSKIDMYLNDDHCKPFLVNSSHVLIKTSHYNCGTKSEVTPDHLIFTNTFIAREETGTGQVVSFFPDVEVTFRCTYDRKKGGFVVSAFVIIHTP